MSTGPQLLARAKRKISDPKYSDLEVYDLLSRGLRVLSSMVTFPSLAATDDTLETSTTSNKIQLPTNYQKGLYAAWYGDSRRSLLVKASIGIIQALVGSSYLSISDPTFICESGDYLEFDTIPPAVNPLEISYYRIPADITADTLKIDGVSNRNIDQAEIAIIHYAAYAAFEDIESGVDGAKIDTDYNLQMFMAIAETMSRNTKGVCNPPPPVVLMERL